MKLTRAQAQQALESVKRQFSAYVEAGYEPQLVENWEPYYNDSTVPFAILWEEGPFEWVYAAHSGGLNEELSEFLGRKADHPAATEWPEGVFAEACTSYVLGLYPTD